MIGNDRERKTERGGKIKDPQGQRNWISEKATSLIRKKGNLSKRGYGIVQT